MSVWHTKQRRAVWITHRRKRKGGTGNREARAYESRSRTIFLSVRGNTIYLLGSQITGIFH